MIKNFYVLVHIVPTFLPLLLHSEKDLAQVPSSQAKHIPSNNMVKLDTCFMYGVFCLLQYSGVNFPLFLLPINSMSSDYFAALYDVSTIYLLNNKESAIHQ